MNNQRRAVSAVPSPAQQGSVTLDEIAAAAFAGLDVRTRFNLVAQAAPASAITGLVSGLSDLEPEDARLAAGRVLAAVVGTAGVLKDAELLGNAIMLARFAGDSVAPEVIGSLAYVAIRAGRQAEVADLLATALVRAPAAVEVLRAAAEAAIAVPDRELAHRLLTRLGQADPRVTTLEAVMRKRRSLGEFREPDVRIALLSSFTVDLLAAQVDLHARALGLTPSVYLAPFNSIGTEVLSPESGFNQSRPDIVFLSVHLDDLIPDLAAGLAGDELQRAGDAALDEIVSYSRAVVERTPARVVVHTLESAYIGASPLDWRPGGRGLWLRSLNARLVEALAGAERTDVLDVGQVTAARSGGSPDNPKMRYLAGMRLGDGSLSALAATYARYLVPLKGLTKKCIVLDLDDTLWGGVVGEDGPTGIRLGNTSPGVEYRDFQLALMSLTRRGVLLALNSKNNPEDALEVIRGHQWMALREDAFSAVRINWESKVDNLRSIAEELNIGLDSMVFVDDNPVQCELVRQMLPQVVTVQLPRDPSLYRSTLEALPWFEQFAVTAEDRERVNLYRANRSRVVLRDTARSLDDYLRSLEIVVRIAPVDTRNFARVMQLLQRTNQFNLTTRRIPEAEMTARQNDPRWRLYTLSANDRFGEHGIVALAFAEQVDDAWRIDTFLMSCRVIGQGVESALLAHLRQSAEADGAGRLIGEFTPSAKNAQVHDFYERHGFEVCGNSDKGSKTLQLVLPAPAPVFPAWIRMAGT